SLWTTWDSSLFGIGFSTSDVGTAGSMAVDGVIIALWLSAGLIVGVIGLGGILWGIGHGIAAAWRDGRVDAVMVGALTFGALLDLPLANLPSGESGSLFWTFAVLATLPPRASLPHGVP